MWRYIQLKVYVTAVFSPSSLGIIINGGSLAPFLDSGVEIFFSLLFLSRTVLWCVLHQRKSSSVRRRKDDDFFDVIIYKPGRNSVVPSPNYHILSNSKKKKQKLQTLLKRKKHKKRLIKSLTYFFIC